jgi:Mrp family chromosome partitioning ATPase
MAGALDDAARDALVTERDAARAELDAARTDAAAIRAALGAEAMPEVPAFRENPAVRVLIDEQTALRTELGREITANPLGNPRIAEIGARLGQIHGMLEAEAVRLAEALDASAAELAARIAEIETQLADADAADAAARELAGLEQSISADRDRLQAALHRQAALTQGGMLPTNVRIVADAQIPRAPEWPPVETLTAIAFAAALLAGIAIVLLREIVNGGAFRRAPFEPLAELDVPSPAEGRVRRPDEHEVGRARTDDPTLAPEIDAEASLGEVADSVAGRRRIIATLAEDSDGDGRPLAAVALARALAGRDRTVVLVDLHADGANPTAMGEVDDLVGFSDLLAGKASFAETIFRDRRSRAHFIPVGSRRLAPDALAGERLVTLLTALDHTYDHVVVDCPDEAIARIAPGADAVLVTSEYGSADPRTVRAVARIARVSDAHIFHLVVAPTRHPPETAEAA